MCPKPRGAAESRWGAGGGLVLKSTWLPQMPMYIQSNLHFCESGGGLWERRSYVFSPEPRAKGETFQWGKMCSKLVAHLSQGDTS